MPIKYVAVFWIPVCVLFLLVAPSARCADDLIIQAVANPKELQLSENTKANLDITVMQNDGAPVSGVVLEILARCGRVRDVIELGNGRYAATYVPPPQRYPQLEILAIRVLGRWISFLPIALRGIGELEVETDPKAKASLLVAGVKFGPVETDAIGQARISFRAPPGVSDGTLFTSKGLAPVVEKRIHLGVPLVQPVLLLAEASEVIADGESQVNLVAFVLDHDNQPLSNGQLQFRAPVGTVSKPVEKAPGVYSAFFRAPSKIGPGETSVALEVTGSDQLYRAATLLRLKPGPLAKLSLIANPDSIPVNSSSGAILEITMEDRTGNPISDAQVSVTSSAGTVGSLHLLEPGKYAAKLEGPFEKTPREIQVIANAVAPGSLILTERISVRLLAPPPEQVAAAPLGSTKKSAPYQRSNHLWSWLSLGAGIAAVVPGAVLLGLDGKETCSAADSVRCPKVYATRLPGGVLTGVGAAFLGTALMLYWLEDDEGNEPASAMLGLQLGSGQAQLLFKGTFSF